MVNVWGNAGVVLKDIFNFGNGYAVFLTLGPIAAIPLYAVKIHIHTISIYFYIFFSRSAAQQPGEKTSFFGCCQESSLRLL